MSFINLYEPLKSLTLSDDELYGPEPYDINIDFPYPSSPAQLSTDRVHLTPFIPRVHAEAYLEGMQGNSEALFWWMIARRDTPRDVLSYFELYMRRRTENLLLAIIDTTRPDPNRPELGGSVAGVIGYMYTSIGELKTEIAPVIVLPAFQRTHVATHAVGILMRYALEVPEKGGMGMRRVVWKTHTDNAASARTATRMGFRFEGVERWGKIMEVGKHEEGKRSREGDPLSDQMGRDDRVYSVCWDDWEDGVREMVDRAISRQ